MPTKTYAKDDIRYWRSKVAKRGMPTGGKSKFSYVRIQYGGSQKWINLNSANADTAASKARDAYLEIVDSGWEAYNAKTKPKPEPSKLLTVGEYLKAVEACGHLSQKTFTLYARKFRTLVSHVQGFGVTPHNSKKLKDGSRSHEKW